MTRRSGRTRGSRDSGPLAPYELYDAVADRAAATVIRRYSTAFGSASRLFAEPVRTQIRTVYAFVRVVDECVWASRPGQDASTPAALLDEVEADVTAALRTGHSANLVVHAFVRTARATGIDAELLDLFFTAMRSDLAQRPHDDQSFAEYVHGSAEVVGLMCLRVFVAETADPAAEYGRLSDGARALGAGFQKINFLRDLAADADDQGRARFPGVLLEEFDRETRDCILDDVDEEMRVAGAMIPELPNASRRAVRAAYALFAALATELRRTPPEVIRRRRVRVTGPRKAQVLARALVRRDR